MALDLRATSCSLREGRIRHRLIKTDIVMCMALPIPTSNTLDFLPETDAPKLQNHDD